MMDDQFLYEARPPVDEAFSRELFEKISGLPGQEPIPAGQVLSRVFIALAAAIVLAAIVSPKARAAITGIVQNIGGLWFHVSGEIEPIGTNNVTVHTVETASLDEIRAQLPFQFKIPSYTPDGYVLLGRVGRASNNSWVSLSWEGSDSSISLLVQKDALYSEDRPVPIGSVEELQIDEKPVAFIRGGWDFESGQWDADFPKISLQWRDGDLVYTLYAVDSHLALKNLVDIYRSFK